MASINHLFPPEVLHDLPTWRFVLHSVLPSPPSPEAVRQAVQNLKAVKWAAVTFPFGIDQIVYDDASKSVDVPIEVPESKRRSKDGLANYESDFWKICGNLGSAGVLGDIYYEAIDWQDEPQ